jgi:hypothetical protein
LASPARQSSLGKEKPPMPTYLVTAHQRIYYGNQSCLIEVEAADEAAAKLEAKRRYADGDLFFSVDDVQDVSEPTFEFEIIKEEKEPAQ